MRFRLNDPLVTSFSYNGKEYSIDLAFDKVLDVFDYLEDKTLLEYEKAEVVLYLLLGENIKGAEAIELWNYVYENFIKIEDKKPIKTDIKGNPLPVQDDDSVKVIDIEKDAEYIFASFKQAYNMNLFQEQGKLHWHEFKALLNGLPSDTIMQRIIQIRLWKPSKHDSAEYKKNMEELQAIYALEDDTEEVDE